MLPNHVPETLVEKETMELQMLANEAQGLSNDRQVETVVSELAPEITPISMDCFKLVGGGSSIIVLE